eukprot:tig00020908_g15312.t1
MGVLQCIDYFALRASTSSFWSWWRRRRSPALRLVRAGAALSRREPPLFLPIALNSSAYALMRVARDGGAAPVDELVLRRLFSHTLDPASPAPPRPLPRPSPPPSCGRRSSCTRRRPPLLENYNVKPDSGVRGRGGTPTRAPGAGPPYTGGPSSTTTSRPPASSSRP